jgi:hypothetical protein
MILGLYIGTQRVDLFKDEDVKLNNSILNISDISKNTTAYTQSFTVPANENNNKIFKHYYNTNIDGGFDARTKVDAKIKIDGLTFKSGNLRLTEVSIKSGLPSSYKLTFFGKTSDLKKTFKNDKLQNLDLSAYNHTFNSANVKQGLQSSLFSGAIIYNLLTKKQYYYNSDASDNTDSDALTNIAANGGNNSVKISDLSASVNVFTIIEAIENDYNIQFSRDFFDRTEFKDLYLYANNTKDNEKTFVQQVDFDGGSSLWVDLTTNVGTFNYSYTDFDNNVFYRHTRKLIPASGFEGVPYTIKTYLDGVLSGQTTYIGTSEQQRNTYEYTTLGDTGSYTLSYEVETNQDFDYTFEWTNQELTRTAGTTTSLTEVTTASLNGVPSDIIVSNYLPDIKIIDFLKGLFNAFKLVVETLEDGTIYVNDVNSYYDSGDLIDVTKHIDFKDFTVTRGELFNEISYSFQEPQTILNLQFTENTGTPYGDEETFLKDEDGELIDGTSQNIDLPFETVVYERLPDLNDGVISNIMYGSIVDEEVNPIAIKPHLFYNINQEVGSKKIAFKNDAGVIETDINNINTASHTNTFNNQLYAFIFSEEFNEWNGNITSNNLYTNYHKNYIDNTFNVKRRNFNYKAILPPSVIFKLSLNDVLKIGKDYYRILSYDLSLLDGKTNLNLINAFDFNLRKLTPNNIVFFINKVAQNVTTYVTNGEDNAFTFTYEDLGFGTSWVSTIQSGANIINSVDENTTGATREIFVIVSLDAVEQFRIYINQAAEILTVDNNIITVDNNIITVDNG